MDTVRLIIFILANLGIVAGYAYLAGVVMPRATVKLRRTKWGGIGFFITCALTHFEMVAHALLEGGMGLDDMISIHMLVIHVLQVIFVWAFVTGLYIEFVKWGPWGVHWQQMVEEEHLEPTQRDHDNG